MIQKEGLGWRLAKDSSKGKFPVLIGGKNWAFELTELEWVSLVQVVNDLVAEHRKIESELMPEELISLEIERQSWWACLDGDRYSWSLKLILQGDGRSERGVEGYWPVPAAQEFVSAMRTIWDS